MIVEMRAYDMRIGCAAEYEKHFHAGLAHRLKFSPLGAFFHTEFGPLNRIIHLWPYQSLAERDRIRAEAASPGQWPPRGAELVLTPDTRIITPAAFSPPLREARLGNFYEICIDTVLSGATPKLIKAWEACIDERTTLSPLAMAGSVTIGPLNQWIHIWPYDTFAQRMKVRTEAAAGEWPPKVQELLIQQEAWIAVPASFSPLH